MTTHNSFPDYNLIDFYEKNLQVVENKGNAINFFINFLTQI